MFQLIADKFKKWGTDVMTQAKHRKAETTEF